jgi:hypothetical protein
MEYRKTNKKERCWCSCNYKLKHQEEKTTNNGIIKEKKRKKIVDGVASEHQEKKTHAHTQGMETYKENPKNHKYKTNDYGVVKKNWKGKKCINGFVNEHENQRTTNDGITNKHQGADKTTYEHQERKHMQMNKEWKLAETITEKTTSNNQNQGKN